MQPLRPNALASFHEFIGQQLTSDSSAQMSPERVLALWREREDKLAAIREGLADVEAGRTKFLEEFDRDFRRRHEIEGTEWLEPNGK